jgi:hypothetical protein
MRRRRAFAGSHPLTAKPVLLAFPSDCLYNTAKDSQIIVFCETKKQRRASCGWLSRARARLTFIHENLVAVISCFSLRFFVLFQAVFSGDAQMTSQWMDTQDRVRKYFRVKAAQVAAIAELAVCDHTGLAGSHREELHRVYLREILPRRFQVGRGMVYGQFHRSREADVVIWDGDNYPSLPLMDHQFFFADAVRLVLECKTAWSDSEFQDVLAKCEAVRDIVPAAGMSLTDQIEFLRQQLAAIQNNVHHEGMIVTHYHIGTAAIFLRGGHSLSPESLSGDLIGRIDDSWPDALLLLQPGRVVIKNYESTPNGGCGWLEFYDFGDDALLAFTTSILALICERSVQIEDPLYLTQYVPDLAAVDPCHAVDFPLTRVLPHRVPIWRRHGENTM